MTSVFASSERGAVAPDEAASLSLAEELTDAILAEDLLALRRALGAGASPDISTEAGDRLPPIALCVAKKFLDGVRELAPVANLDARDAFGMAAIHHAAAEGSPDALELLLASGAPLSSAKNGYSPFAFAFLAEAEGVFGAGLCARFLAPKTDFARPDGPWSSFLHHAAFLTEHHPDFDSVDLSLWSSTALDLAWGLTPTNVRESMVRHIVEENSDQRDFVDFWVSRLEIGQIEAIVPTPCLSLPLCEIFQSPWKRSLSKVFQFRETQSLRRVVDAASESLRQRPGLTVERPRKGALVEFAEPGDQPRRRL
jgi:hypothetical protein